MWSRRRPSKPAAPARDGEEAAEVAAEAAAGEDRGESPPRAGRGGAEARRRRSKEVARRRKCRQHRRPREPRPGAAGDGQIPVQEEDDDVPDEVIEQELGLAPHRRRRGSLLSKQRERRGGSQKAKNAWPDDSESEGQGGDSLPKFRPPPSRAEKAALAQRFLAKLSTYQEIKRKQQAMEERAAGVFIGGARVDATSAQADCARAISTKYKSDRLARCPYCIGVANWCPFHANRRHNAEPSLESIPPPRVDLPADDSEEEEQDMVSESSRPLMVWGISGQVRSGGNQDVSETGKEKHFMSLSQFRAQLGAGDASDEA